VDPLPFFQIFIHYHFKDGNFAGGPRGQGLVENQVHLAQVLVCDLVQLVLRGIKGLHNKGMPLSVERVNLIKVFIVKALVGEILFRLTQHKAYNLSHELFLPHIVKEVVVGASVRVKQVNEE
jgi:hypothetical protein